MDEEKPVEQPISEPVVGKPTPHRDVDENGNPDDKFTEEEALAKAEAEGITFVDTFFITNYITMTPHSDERYATRQEAVKAFDAIEDKTNLTIAQERKQAN